MSITPPACPTVAEAKTLVAKGEAKPSDLVRMSLARIEATEPLIHATITVCAEEALHEASRLDALVGTAEAKAMPLLGVPLTVKDLFCTKGVRTTAASRTLENFVPPYDASAVEALKKAGAIIVAKTNTDEFAMGTSTETSLFGPSKNPWDTSRIPGGSSGGAAASTVAGQSCGALGSDSGGSTRVPAALCGCVGLKPTYGRVSRYGAVAYASSFDQTGILGRSVEDCALILETIAGFDEKDATCVQLPVPAYSQGISREDLKGITLGLPKELWDQGVAPEIMEACNQAVAAAKELGATVVEVSLPHIKYSAAAYSVLATAEASTNLARFDGVRFGLRAYGDSNDSGLVEMYETSRSLGFGLEVKRRILLGTHVLSHGLYEEFYVKAAKVRRLIHQDFVQAFSGCQALLSPVTLTTAEPFGSSVQDDPLYAYKMDILASGLNLSGMPGLSLPVGLGRETNLPVGLQVMGKAFDEATVLAVSAALEGVLPKLGEPRGLM